MDPAGIEEVDLTDVQDAARTQADAAAAVQSSIGEGLSTANAVLASMFGDDATVERSLEGEGGTGPSDSEQAASEEKIEGLAVRDMHGVKVARYAVRDGDGAVAEASSQGRGAGAKKLRGSAAVLARMAQAAGGAASGSGVMLRVGQHQLQAGASARGFVPGGAARFVGGSASATGASASSSSSSSSAPSFLLREGGGWDTGMKEALRKEKARKDQARAAEEKAARKKQKQLKKQEQIAFKSKSKTETSDLPAKSQSQSQSQSQGEQVGQKRKRRDAPEPASAPESKREKKKKKA